MTENPSVRVERSYKRLRTYLGGELVVDTTAPLLVWENAGYPSYYVPQADVAMELLAASDEVDRSPSLGEARLWTVKTGRAQAEHAARQYPESPAGEIRDAIRFDWNAMDSWFEEDEEVFVHPRDPHKRIDALRSSRHVVVEIDGVPVADSSRPVLLFETGLPTRYYLPKTDVRMDLLTASDSLTRCPYKGVAEYYSVSRRGKDLRRHRLVVPQSGPRIGGDRRSRGVLQREGRPHRRRRSRGAAGHDVLLSRPGSGPVLLCSSASFSPLQAPFQGRDVPVSKKCRLRTLVLTLGVVRQAL